jgi:hypothetical protein
MQIVPTNLRLPLLFVSMILVPGFTTHAATQQLTVSPPSITTDCKAYTVLTIEGNQGSFTQAGTWTVVQTSGEQTDTMTPQVIQGAGTPQNMRWYYIAPCPNDPPNTVRYTFTYTAPNGQHVKWYVTDLG